MIISCYILKSSYDKYYRLKRNKEKFSNKKTKFSINSFELGSELAYSYYIYIVSIIFFVMELIVLYYAISIAFNCTKGGPERIVNFILACFFTVPYVMLNILFNKCSKSLLRDEL